MIVVYTGRVGVFCLLIQARYLTVSLVHLQINAATFSCPFWFSPGAKSLIERMLDPNPKTVSIHHCPGSKNIESYLFLSSLVSKTKYIGFKYF